ncbi:hypothetical protein FGG08_005596 [Glutinoglossum americanum]|uniref:tRNA ligase n=1 Tax=Glutinoglossum americanum TaxID=1670608 RepID=A0A9P8L2S0_9PEZI|nr:hypothetical protein FGG08_005596 [Glutinoglossum americanum]
MAQQENALYTPQEVREVAGLIRSLEAGAKKGPGGQKKSFTCKKTTFVLAGTDGVTVDSWRFNDWDYKNPDLPTYARGLFTFQTNGKPGIAIRGYDKFFNTEEVNKTRWHNVETNTRGPYELSVKENGCIIFISGLPDDKLLVCSKHSTGVRSDVAASHAVVGERWVDRQLNALGKTRKDLAQELRSRNATAVAELCDDSFEEHVLAYVGDRAGLYLHGINLNLPEFATYPGHLVHKFADEWGFKKVEFLVKDDIQDVRTFLEGVAETGAWQDKEIEGFVIRCQARDSEGEPWHDWFFKYKFEEPYLMYRQWREVTKAIIAGRNPKYKKHQKITGEYLKYARRQLASDRTLGKKFNQNQGIIAMRNGFLKERGLTGAGIIQMESEDGGEGSADVMRDVLLTFTATIGCGKTTVAVALQKLFGWSVVQNDNIEGMKGRSRRFVGEISSAFLTGSSVVIADRNNHQRRERKQLIEDVKNLIPNATIVAIHFVHEQPGVSRHASLERIRQVTRDRVFSRGDNHQTIQAGTKSQPEITGIMEGFLNRFEAINILTEPDEWFDTVIDLDPTASSRENLEAVVSRLHSLYPKLFHEMPTGDDMDEAIEFAIRDYEPALKQKLFSTPSSSKKEAKAAQKSMKLTQNPRLPKIDYFCIRLPPNPILTVLESHFKAQDAMTQRFYRQLQQSRRIQPSFHITIIHRANSKEFPDVWERFNTMHKDALTAATTNNTNIDNNRPEPELETCRVVLERVVWDSRVMAVVTRLLDAQEKDLGTTNELAHITVGTADQSIKPKESNDLLHTWLSGGSGEGTGISEMEIKGNVVIGGSVRGVLQRY